MTKNPETPASFNAPPKRNEKLELALSTADREFEWAGETNWQKIPEDPFLEDIQIKASMYLFSRGQGNLETQFNGRFGPKTRELLLRFFEAARINYDKNDFDEKTGRVTLRENVIKQINDLSFEMRPTDDFDYLGKEVDEYKREDEKEFTDLVLEAKSLVPDVSVQTASAIFAAAKLEGIPPKQLFALIYVESSFDASASNLYGFRGLGQLNLHSTLDVMERDLKTPDAPQSAFTLFYDERRFLSPSFNSRLAAKYFKMCKDAVKSDDFRLIYLAYNQGPAKIGGLVGQFGKNPDAIWKRIKMGNANPKEAVQSRVKTAMKVFGLGV